MTTNQWKNRALQAEAALRKIVEDRSHVDPFALEMYTDILTECHVPFERTYNGGLQLKVGE